MKAILSILAALLGLIFLLALGSWAAETMPVDTVGLVRFASDQGVRARAGNAEPGVLVAVPGMDSGSNSVSSLYLGGPDRKYLPVYDKFALRRTPFEFLDYPDFYIEPGTNTTLVGDHTVRVFDGDYIPYHSEIDPNTPRYTRTFRLIPINGKVIEGAKVKCTYFQAEGWSGLSPQSILLDLSSEVTASGEVIVQATVQGRSVPVTYTIDISFSEVIGRDGHMNDPVDDLTFGDYKFIDTYGRISLGTLRSWIRQTYDAQRAQHWANYPASNTVNLACNALRFSRDTFFRTETTENANDTLVLYQNGNTILKSVAGAGGPNGNFRIIGIDFQSSGTYDYIYTTKDVTDPPYILTCDDIGDAQWTRPNGQTTTPGTWQGEPAWVIAVPKDGSHHRFYKALSNSAETSAVLYTEAVVYARRGVALQDDNGNWWRLKVSTSGTVSGEAITNAPSWLGGM